MKLRKLTEQAWNERVEFNANNSGCCCHTNPPCGHCTHPGNPLNQEDESCFEEVNLLQPDKLIYLAQPYSGMEEWSFLQAKFFVAKLMVNDKFKVYSPILNCHPLATVHELPTLWSFWQEFDLLMLSKCDALFVLRLPGWDVSKGVSEEIKFAKENNIPIAYML